MMNNLFGIGTSLGDLAKDFNGFVREVVGELQTVTTEAENNNVDNDSEFDEEQAIEAELKHQLLELSDDEDNGSTIRISNAEENNDNISQNPSDDANNDQHEQKHEQKQEQKQETKSLKEYDDLHKKYIELKQNYRKSMLLVEKYQIYNKSLKETLNEQMIIREQQQTQINQHLTINDQLNEKIIKLQNEIDTINTNKKECEENKISIFEEETAVKSDETDKLRKTLQKASVNMKELKRRYMKIKQDLCDKIEQFDELKSQYVTYKMSSTDALKKLTNKLKESMNNALNKELQTILNAKYIQYGMCKMDIINPLHLEMIALLNGCIETMSWISTNSQISKYADGINMDDNKSDSVVIIDGNNSNSVDTVEINMNELETIKMSVICLREVVCEYIAMIQQWLKVLNDAIERKQDIDDNQNGDQRKQSSTEEFQSID